MISHQTIATIQEVVRIEDVVQDFVTLKKKGNNLWACCPFHHEKTPSFTISPTKGFYKCFGCGAAGNVITFLKSIEGFSFVEAIQYLGKKYGIAIEEVHDSQSITTQNTQESLYILLNRAQQYFEKNLHSHTFGSVARSYCIERKIPTILLEKFGIGYSFSTGNHFLTYAQEASFDQEILLMSGLVIAQEKKVYDRFRGRLIFPIHNLSGKVIGFGGRLLANNTQQPKYINSPETLLYQKRKALYGLFQAKKAIIQHDFCYVVEGYTDVLALHQAGMENVVAPLGTALTADHLQLISRFTQQIVLLFDQDKAGVQAVLKSIDLIVAQDMHVYIVALPPEEDPDSFVQKNTAAEVQSYCKIHKQNFVSFKAQILLQTKINDPLAKTQVIKNILQTIVSIQDEVTRMLYIKMCSEYFQMDEATLLAECHRMVLHKQDSTKKNISSHVEITWKKKEKQDDLLQKSIHIQERESIRMLLFYGDQMINGDVPLHQYFSDALQEVTYTLPLHQKILQCYKKNIANNLPFDLKSWVHHTDEDIQKFTINFMVSHYTISDVWEKKYQIYVIKEEDELSKNVFKNILRLKLRLIQKFINDNLTLLKEPTPTTDIMHLVSIHQTLKKTETEIAHHLGIILTH